MTAGKNRQTGHGPKRYLWFGFGNYGGQPTQQIGGGMVRDPNLFDKSIQKSGGERSVFISVAAALLGFTFLAMLLAWVVSLIAG